ncbi:RNA 2',3'-cyclic phosphodiesterase [Acidipropionibacterium virtanenii]|uniref:RNA 2',3'-cyclic phosphodiesterase n=2 Tax=Acidipropionibacterium virtanenii TaxID=2057246 RepID=A0A344UXF2_9ACTN|nr:RNA 2',3'-cyclic phosphodiesterase [Acidipropionibacterium virtanenii]
MYAALVPPAEVLRSIDETLERMSGRTPPSDPRRLRWSRPGDSHITLVFMAEVDDPDTLIDALTEALAGRPPVAVGLGGAGAFPRPDRAKILWLGVADPAGTLPALARRARSAARSAGARPESGPFRPHVTAARAHDADVTGEIEALSSFGAPMWVARSVTLFASHLPRPGGRKGQGPRHEPVAEIGLEGIPRRSQFRSPNQ